MENNSYLSLPRDIALSNFSRLKMIYSKDYMQIWIVKYIPNGELYIHKVFQKAKLMEDERKQASVLNERDMLKLMQEFEGPY